MIILLFLTYNFTHTGFLSIVVCATQLCQSTNNSVYRFDNNYLFINLLYFYYPTLSYQSHSYIPHLNHSYTRSISELFVHLSVVISCIYISLKINIWKLLLLQVYQSILLYLKKRQQNCVNNEIVFDFILIDCNIVLNLVLQIQICICERVQRSHSLSLYHRERDH